MLPGDDVRAVVGLVDASAHVSTRGAPMISSSRPRGRTVILITHRPYGLDQVD